MSYWAEQGKPEGLVSNIQEGNRKSVVQEANRWAPVFSQSSRCLVS